MFSKETTTISEGNSATLILNMPKANCKLNDVIEMSTYDKIYAKNRMYPLLWYLN